METENWDFTLDTIEESRPSRSLKALYPSGNEEDGDQPERILQPRKKSTVEDGDFPFELLSETQKRGINPKKSVTEEDFLKDCLSFENGLKSTGFPSMEVYQEEIDSWNLQIPDRDATDVNEIMKVYNRLYKYRWRLTEMLTHAKSFRTLARFAYQNLFDVAFKLYDGHAHDKKAQAHYRVREWGRAAAEADKTHDMLLCWKDTLVEMSIMLSTNMKHLQAASNVNKTWTRIAESDRYSSLSNNSDDGDDENEAPIAPRRNMEMSRSGAKIRSKQLKSAIIIRKI